METGVTLTQEQMLSLNKLQVTPLIAYLAENDSTDLVMLESDLTLSHGINCAQIRKLERVVGKKNIIKAIR